MVDRQIVNLICLIGSRFRREVEKRRGVCGGLEKMRGEMETKAVKWGD